MAVEDAVHLQHASCLAKVNIGPHGISGSPFVYDDEAKSLDVGQIGVVQVLID